MDRAYSSGAAGSAPTAPASPSIGYPSAGNPGTGTPATKPGAYWYHMMMEEMLAVIAAAGITPDWTKLTQLASAIQSGKLFSSAAGGTADAITASFSPAITTLFNGMALYIRAAAANATTTPTFTPNNGTVAAKQIVKGAGAALAVGDIAGGGHWIELQYDATLDRWVLLNPATGVSAATAFASNAEAQALSIATKALSPSTLAAALKGGNQSLAASGYQKLPGGLIIQWGSVAGVSNSSVAVTFPVAFPSACRSLVVGSELSSGASATYIDGPNTITNSGFNMATYYPRNVRWIAIGN